MSIEHVLIAGTWREAGNPAGTFHAVNPANKSALPGTYPVSGIGDINELLEAGLDAARALRTAGPARLSDFLESYADQIECCTDKLVNMAHLETALPVEPRLRSLELPRTTGQLRKAAAAARELSWCHATIDTKTNIRSKYGPIGGPIIIFGPNNFPLAFNAISGGDFAAAITAGNPVIAKGNPGHPGTTRILADAAFKALKKSGLHPATIQLLYHTTPECGVTLVSHPSAGATAFTGSKAAGLTLKKAADSAGKPIYLEMSSINPVFILPGAVMERSEEIAAGLFHSCSLGAGQFCTKPGLIVLREGEDTESFIHALSSEFSKHSPGILLSASGVQNIVRAVTTLLSAGAEIITGGQPVDEKGFAYANTLLRVRGDVFLQQPDALQTEAFGTVSVIVTARDTEQMTEIASKLGGNLTGSIYSDTRGSDDIQYTRIESVLRSRVGRLLNDKMPTGVAVVPSMSHGGPYPATGHPGFTAVGIPASLLRFTALHCYDNVRHHRLPGELQDKNPTGKMWRLIDGEWTREDI